MSRELAKIRMNGGRRGNPSLPENPMPMSQRKGAEATCDSTYVRGNWLPRNKHLPMMGKYLGIEYNLPNPGVISLPLKIAYMIRVSEQGGADTWLGFGDPSKVRAWE